MINLSNRGHGNGLKTYNQLCIEFSTTRPILSVTSFGSCTNSFSSTPTPCWHTPSLSSFFRWYWCYTSAISLHLTIFNTLNVRCAITSTRATMFSISTVQLTLPTNPAYANVADTCSEDQIIQIQVLHCHTRCFCPPSDFIVYFIYNLSFTCQPSTSTSWGIQLWLGLIPHWDRQS